MTTKTDKRPWETLPKGWTQDSVEKMWDSVTGDAKHKVSKCIKEMQGKVTDPGAFCASLADKVEGKGWRSREAMASRVVSRFKEAAKKPKKPTFAQARQIIFDHLKAEGWVVKDKLKVPNATSPDKEYRLWFKKQAIYATYDDTGIASNLSFKHARSISDDMRNLIDGRGQVNSRALAQGLDHAKQISSV